MRYGDPNDPKTYMGPLISEKQRDKVDGMVQRAVAAGATLVTGGEQKGPGYFYTPTLLSDVDPDSEIAQEEVFGPVLVGRSPMTMTTTRCESPTTRSTDCPVRCSAARSEH